MSNKILKLEDVQTILKLEDVPTILKLEDGTKILRQVGDVYHTSGVSGIKNEVPFGAVNSMNATYTSALAFNGSTLEVFRNGIKQKVIEDFNITNAATFVFLSAPLTGDIILINYTSL